ncbi:hypothetical protein GCM10010166_49890 [Couchioplanes caeruleus subsp. azureus]|nr:hypothetical protein GCM10010166_49890 [Couchioplanes caeruleus subsp. azureus]
MASAYQPAGRAANQVPRRRARTAEASSQLSRPTESRKATCPAWMRSTTNGLQQAKRAAVCRRQRPPAASAETPEATIGK